MERSIHIVCQWPGFVAGCLRNCHLDRGHAGDHSNGYFTWAHEKLWRIVRNGRRSSERTFKTEEAAQRAWKKLDVREGNASLYAPDGTGLARQSAPMGVRTRW